ncbi:MAG: hypothetical protein O3C21_17315, partial [Verrucomicrobia bacterium]|nr:hypothetical protein [Verrucomicrobiota bacterium]
MKTELARVWFGVALVLARCQRGSQMEGNGRVLLLLSTLCFLVGFIYAFLTLRSDNATRSRMTLVFMGSGFLLQGSFLYLRGQLLGRCPITNVPELLVFLSWAVVLYSF